MFSFLNYTNKVELFLPTAACIRCGESLKYAMIFQQEPGKPHFIMLAGAVWLTVLIYFLIGFHMGDRQVDAAVVLNDFQSDFHEKESRRLLYSDTILKDQQFIAYGSYVTLEPGVYEARCSLISPGPGEVKLELQIAASRGREVLAVLPIECTTFPARFTLSFEVTTEQEVEPRLLWLKGQPGVRLDRVELVQTATLFPWQELLLKSVFWASILTWVLSLFWLSLGASDRWRVGLALFFVLIGAFLILRNTWVSEDAFITMRHVENFISGYGPVFNVEERVEGYTHALWFYIVSFLRFLGLSPKGAVVIPGLLFSSLSLYLLFFKVGFSPHSDRPPLNPAAAVLIGTSAFIDFGTSGLETSLSYFLLMIYGLMIATGRWIKQPLLMGLVMVLLILTRPDFGVFFILILLFYLVKLFKKQIKAGAFLLYLACPLFLLGGYQVFRMGYYAAVFPNPVLTKSAFGSYFAQGIRYLLDFSWGSAFLPAVLIAVTGVAINIGHEGLKRRLMVFGSGMLHGFFVIRGGGDFMHGRFLLPAFILMAVSVSGAFDRFLKNRRWYPAAALTAALLLFGISSIWTPVQQKGDNFHFGISDERSFYYEGEVIPLKYLFQDTVIIMWKNIGLNYRHLSERTRLKISTAYKNVGFTGFYSGPRVFLIDRLGLTDPVVARIALPGRRRPGHEKSAPLGYLILKRPTFADTPFSLWNRWAQTPFGVLWDLSPRTLRRMRFTLPEDFKQNLDRRMVDYLRKLAPAVNSSQAEADFLYFMERFWYPYADAALRKVYDQAVDRETVHLQSPACRWIQNNRQKVEALNHHITGKLDAGKFIRNIGFSLTSTFKLRF